MEKVRYNHLNNYLKQKFGERVLKICVDAGFTCPNRDGTKSVGGCAFCGSLGAGDLIKYRTENIYDSIKSQVNGFLESYRGERANKFIVYFQSFSNTYDSIDNLRLKYNTALAVSDKIIGLQVATRPDCVDEKIAKLLSSYKDKYYVCVELGLQTANDIIGENINRQYTTQDFVNACELLHRYDIDVVAHIMLGLPGESPNDIKDVVDKINKCRVDGVKIHSTYVLQNTMFDKMYREGHYQVITQDYYVDSVAKIISNLDKDIIIHRINADPPKDKLIAPEWTLKKKVVINQINKILNELDVIQGDKKLTL